MLATGRQRQRTLMAPRLFDSLAVSLRAHFRARVFRQMRPALFGIRFDDASRLLDTLGTYTAADA